MFVGKGSTFEIWEPMSFSVYLEKAKAEALAALDAEKAAKAAERAEKKRLADCKRKGIAEKDCPALEEAEG